MDYIVLSQEIVAGPSSRYLLIPPRAPVRVLCFLIDSFNAAIVGHGGNTPCHHISLGGILPQ